MATESSGLLAWDDAEEEVVDRLGTHSSTGHLQDIDESEWGKEPHRSYGSHRKPYILEREHSWYVGKAIRGVNTGDITDESDLEYDSDVDIASFANRTSRVDSRPNLLYDPFGMEGLPAEPEPMMLMASSEDKFATYNRPSFISNGPGLSLLEASLGDAWDGVAWDKRISEANFHAIFYVLWVLVLGCSASSLVFWLPSVFYPNSDDRLGINITSIVLNCSGAFIIAITHNFYRVKSQYFQTYIMYEAIMGGFCSVLTTFGNVVADTGRLMLSGVWYLAIINLVLQLALAICTYQLGRALARKWKPASRYTNAAAKLDNEDARMAYELDRQLDTAEKEEFRQIQEEGKKKGKMAKVKSYNRYFGYSELDKVEKYRKKLVEKALKHKTHWLTPRHKVIVSLNLLWFAANIGVVTLLGVQNEHFLQLLPDWFPNSGDPRLLYDYWITVGLSVSGALIGGFLGAGGYNMADSIQWGTFKVNMISCILIGIANNLSLFYFYIPFTSPYTAIFLYRFVVSFCGSESSFAGLIDETMVIWNGKTGKRRKNSVRNLFYTLIVCLGAYFLVIIAVRVAIFFRYWSPSTAALYLCSGSFFVSC